MANAAQEFRHQACFTRPSCKHPVALHSRLVAAAIILFTVQLTSLGGDGFTFVLGRTLKTRVPCRSGSAVASSLAELAPPLRDADLGVVIKVDSEEAMGLFKSSRTDFVVMITFSWCKACKVFMPKYKRLAKNYANMKFLTIVANENNSTEHYAKVSMSIKKCPMFALHSKGKLVKTWTGTDTNEFVKHVDYMLNTPGRKLKALAMASYP